MKITYYIFNFMDKHMDIIQYACNTFRLNHCTHFPWNSFTNNTNFALIYQTVIKFVYTCILSLMVLPLCLAQRKCSTDEVYTCSVEPVRYNCTLPDASLVLSSNTNPDFLIQWLTI